MCSWHCPALCALIPLLGLALAGQNPAHQHQPERGCTIAFVKSDREWKYGIRTESFDSISEYLVNQLGIAFEKKGIHLAPSPETARCHLTVDLLEVTSHAATIK